MADFYGAISSTSKAKDLVALAHRFLADVETPRA